MDLTIPTRGIDRIHHTTGVGGTGPILHTTGVEGNDPILRITGVGGKGTGRGPIPVTIAPHITTDRVTVPILGAPPGRIPEAADRLMEGTSIAIGGRGRDRDRTRPTAMTEGIGRIPLIVDGTVTTARLIATIVRLLHIKGAAGRSRAVCRPGRVIGDGVHRGVFHRGAAA